MKKIPLTQGKFAVVDDDVFEWASKFKWFAKKDRNNFYAGRKIRLSSGKRRIQYLHREILKAARGVQVDHIDGNGLNDLLENMRLCSRAENGRNRRKNRNNTSGYQGVHFSCADKWLASVRVDGVRVHLGCFDTAIEAAHARDAAAIKVYGEFARLNFPKSVTTPI